MRIALNARQLGEHARFFATPPRAARFSPYRLRQLDVIFCQLFTRRARRSAKRTPRAHAHGCEFRGRHLVYAMAKTTFEEGDRPLHRARFKERPQIALPLSPGRQEMRFTPPACIVAFGGRSEGLGADCATGQKCISLTAADGLEPSPADDPETQTAETRFCEGCGTHFQLARPWSRFCSPACRLRAHRRLARA